MLNPDHKLLQELRAADRRVSKARANYEEATSERARLIAKASETKGKVWIAKAIGVTPMRIQQILEAHERANGKK